jgi:DNA repair protein RecO (recombination protein O)
MRVQDQPIYILHHRAYQDTSQILEIFSRDYGRLAVMSRGSRGPKSKLKAFLQPFNSLLVSWSGKGELPLLTKAEQSDQKAVRLAGKALPSAFYINELLMRLLHRHDVNEEIFDLYRDVLLGLENTENLETDLRVFEKKLLQILGFGLNLVMDIDANEQVQESLSYAYYIEHGPVLVSDLNFDPKQLVIKGKTLLAFENNNLSDAEMRKEIKSLMRYVLSYYLGDKPLKSRELFRR